ncbi:MAG: PASTA domain-containing protein [Bacteroidales bacterium]|nr:PASTA domain-containing protein [Bacteroidales bacterium]
MKIKGFFKVIFSKKFLIQYGIAVLFIIAVISITFLSLRISTNHGEAFSLPDFTGLTVNQALKKGDDLNLKIEVIDSVYNGLGRRGTVIDQNPPPDFKVKSHRKIFITIKSVSPKIIKMPDFIHTTLVQAKSDIETYGLRIGKITYEPSIYDNVVLEQKYRDFPIAAGTEIPQGAEIELVLGRSEDMGRTITPDLYGLTLENAELEAAEFMMNIGTVLYDETVISYNDSVSARVLRQRPKANISSQPGNEIDIVLSMITDTIPE